VEGMVSLSNYRETGQDLEIKECFNAYDGKSMRSCLDVNAGD